MFESLSEKLQDVFRRLGNKGRLTEKDVDEALREVRQALLAADVNFKVVKEFVARVREQIVGEDVLQSLTPEQHVIKVVHDELVSMLGGGEARIAQAQRPPTVVMLVGLQGSGKTTTAAKLALHLRRSHHKPLLVAADVYRPAAIDQLKTLGKQLDIPVYDEGPKGKPVDICRNAIKRARETASNFVILDTAGRLEIDEAMMKEVADIRATVAPDEVLLVADAMTGQVAVQAADQFNQQVGLTGLILTKVDGDARGGAALSVKQVTGVPIKYLGTGEKTDALEIFHPDRLASRILGMGDILTLIEKAQTDFDEQRALELQKKMRTQTFDLEDFLEQLRQIKKMGPLNEIIGMIPGMGQLKKQMPQNGMDENHLKRIEAIILSMTPAER
ncbi:MAG TPA: signal recognition particle protein, partial [Dehalococcoidia bacterium]|nr:signal recognition particle protein [Dehalococcoidia bacterium]